MRADFIPHGKKAKPIHFECLYEKEQYPEDVDEKGILEPIEGQPPSLISVPTGCAFHPRCAYARDVCKTDVPDLKSLADGRLSSCHFSDDPDFLAQREDASQRYVEPSATESQAAGAPKDDADAGEETS
jgi:oligopeptide transport system ATP-binding protein